MGFAKVDYGIHRYIRANPHIAWSKKKPYQACLGPYIIHSPVILAEYGWIRR